LLASFARVLVPHDAYARLSLSMLTASHRLIARTAKSLSSLTSLARQPALCHILFVMSLLGLLAVSGCGSHGGAPQSLSTSARQTPATAATAAAPELDPKSFTGPVIVTCARSDGDGKSTISKVNLSTGQVVALSTFPDGGCPEGGTDTIETQSHDGDFSAQRLRNLFSPDYSKRVLLNPGGAKDHVGYYDAKTHQLVDVSQKLSTPQPTGDFGQVTTRVDAAPAFDDKGLFVFYDNNADQYEYVDTETEKIVQTAHAPFVPHVAEATNDGGIDRAGQGYSEYSYLPRTCLGLWLIDDSRYLREILGSTASSSTNVFIGLDTVPPPTNEGATCDFLAGQRITPSMDDLLGAATDPSGSTVAFLLKARGGDDVKLYQIGIGGGTPVEVPVPRTFLGTLDTASTIIAWE
jgi:hypothetical protein